MKKVRKKIIPIFGLCLLTLTSCDNIDPRMDKINIPSRPMELERDKYGNYYHIFVPTYRDSNEDGIGDLDGVIDSLDYLRRKEDPYGYGSLGVDGIYLSPIFQAPSYHKYDAVSYYSIDKNFGTLDTLKELIKEAHDRSIKIIMDMAFNHISTQSDEFIKATNALKNDSVCKTPDSEGKPSTDCVSKYKEVGYFNFRDSSNQSGKIFDSVSGTSYGYETFSNGSNMADWNLDNPDVQNLIKEVIEFYSKLGIDGYRLDAITSFYGNNGKIGSLEDLEKTNKILSLVQQTAESINPNSYVVAEGPWSNSDLIKNYSEDSSQIVSLMSSNNIDSFFSFDDSINKKTGRDGRLNQIYDDINYREDNLNELIYNYFEKYEVGDLDQLKVSEHKKIRANFLSNHDIGRFSQFWVKEMYIENGNDIYENQIRTYKFFYALYNLCYGNVFNYYGDEIGMTGWVQNLGNIDYKDTIARQPMLWTDQELRPTLDQVPTGNKEIFDTSETTLNVLGTMDDQINDANSVFNFIRQVNYAKYLFRDIQKEFATNLSKENNGYFSMEKGESLKIIVNCSSSNQSYDIATLKENNYSLKYYLLSNIDDAPVLESGNKINMPKYSIAFYFKGGN